MVLEPGDAEGVRRTGIAAPISGFSCSPATGKRTLLLIEKKERHEIRNTGRGVLRTRNFYAPPAYRTDGEPLPRGKK